ncbi:hypothetical protein [Spiroplasma endosymbiont of Othius punctulatus]|uniref:hypothetical protein n=1 Tax=Spiroplasma endosymbiont of Othius punctulatus TaxID=3066289 RepID=UPI0030D31EDD
MNDLQITFLVIGIIAIVSLLPLIYFFVLKIKDWKIEASKKGFETTKKTMLGSVFKQFQMWLWIFILFFIVLIAVFCIAMLAGGIDKWIS